MTSDDMYAHDLDWPQLARYLGGELSPAEARALECWFDGDERRRRILAEARAAWVASAAPQGTWDAEAGVRRLRQAVRATETARIAEVAPPRIQRAPSLIWRPTRRWGSVALAASLAALAASGLALWSRYRPGDGTVGRSVSVAMTEITTRRGQRAEVRLPDGSRVTLGVASRLRYPRDFGVKARTLELEGEGYFEVVHDRTRPFRVRAGGSELEDIGTAFDVRAYDGRPLRVVVAEGAVQVHHPLIPGNGALLTVAQLVQIDNRGVVRRNGIAVDEYLAWRHDELVFDDATLAAVAEELGRWYDVDVQVADSVAATRRFTGAFGHQAVGRIVAAIAAATDVTAERSAGGGWRFR